MPTTEYMGRSCPKNETAAMIAPQPGITTVTNANAAGSGYVVIVFEASTLQIRLSSESAMYMFPA